MKNKHKRRAILGELFVPGASAYITFSLNIERRIANRVPVEYHSVSFLDKDFGSEVLNTIECCGHSDIITIKRPPDFINVELFPECMVTTKPLQ